MSRTFNDYNGGCFNVGFVKGRDNMNHNIKPIEGFDGYFISKDGKVYCNLGNGCRDRSKRVDLYEIKPRPGKTGYMRVYMRNTELNKRMDRYVHRLVATHFIPNPYNKNVVNHIDCDRSNNHVDNLEWVTTKENLNHAMTVGSLKRNEQNGRYERK